MKLVQASQTLTEFVSIVVKISGRCPTFTSPEVIHRDSPNPGLFGLRPTDIRAKYCSLAMQRSRDAFRSSGQR